MGPNMPLLCGTNTAQHDVFCHSQGCFSGQFSNQVLLCHVCGKSSLKVARQTKVQSAELLYADDMD